MKITPLILFISILSMDEAIPKYLYDVEEHKVIKPCGKDKEHIMCQRRNTPLPNCTQFAMWPMDNQIIERIMIGINGLRSKAALQPGYEIANMNLLHWDADLAEMAKQYILRCNINETLDIMDYIGNPNHTVRRNHYFTNIFLKHPHWFQHPIKTWYNESRLAQLTSSSGPSSYSQLIWPTTEYVGCSGATVFRGTFFVCYFAPPADETRMTRAFIQGMGCTECPAYQPTCSAKYGNLCGHDFAVTGSQPNHYMLAVLSLIILIDICI